MTTRNKIFLETNEASYKEIANFLKFLFRESQNMTFEFFEALTSFTEPNTILKSPDFFIEAFEALKKTASVEADFTVIGKIEETRREINRIHHIISRSSL